MNNNQGRSQDFQRGGGRFFIDKGKAGSARCLRTFMRLFGTGVPGGFRKTFHFLAFESPRLRENWHPECFFLSELFQYNDDFYGDFYGDLYGDLYGDFYGDFYGDTFVATNFLISLFLFFPLYDFYLILLASQRAFQRASLAKGGSRSHSPTPPGYAPVHIVSLGCCGLSTDKICGRRSGPHTRQD